MTRRGKSMRALGGTIIAFLVASTVSPPTLAFAQEAGYLFDPEAPHERWFDLGQRTLEASVDADRDAHSRAEPWPLGLLVWVPVLAVLDRGAGSDAPLSRGRLVGLGLLLGFVTNAGGYYWVVGTLERFSGFPVWLCVLLASVLWLYQGAQLLVISWLMHRALWRGWAPSQSM